MSGKENLPMPAGIDVDDDELLAEILARPSVDRISGDTYKTTDDIPVLSEDDRRALEERQRRKRAH